MSLFRRRVAAVTGAAEDSLERLAGGDLSEVVRAVRLDGSAVVAKSGVVAAEATMLRAIAEAGVPAPAVEGEFDGVLLLECVDNDGLFTPRAWADIGSYVRRLHDVTGEIYGWPVDFAFGTVEISNRQGKDWRRFWIEDRLLHAAATLDRPWRDRLAELVPAIAARLPEAPRPALLHGDLWSGNILVRDGTLAALIDPACYHGDAEVDLAMLSLFSDPPAEFWDAHGPLSEGWEQRRPVYQLFPALIHLRLFGAGYAGLADRLMSAIADGSGAANQ